MSTNNQKVNFKYGSISHKVLCYLKMVNKPVMPKDVVYVFRGRFRHSGDAKKTLDVLVRNKCAENNQDGSYMITKKGLDVIGLSGKRQYLVVHRSSLL